MTDVKKLCTKLRLNPKLQRKCVADKRFPLKVTPDFIAKMICGNDLDPLLLQILPLQLEHLRTRGFKNDPLAEKAVNPIPGLLHKYYGRVLLLVTDQCAINCRYCFRRFTRASVRSWPAVFSYIKNNTTLSEVILSGGDPLMLSDKKLGSILQKLASIPHIKRVRVHTRMPVVCPKRITSNLVKTLVATRLPVIVVIHANHPNELDQNTFIAIKHLRQANITVLNQSVLLRGVNDSAATLIALSESLFAAGVLPYYLHQLDKVKGAAHFEVNLKNAKAIYREIKRQLPGYLVPKFVYEKVGAVSKIEIV